MKLPLAYSTNAYMRFDVLEAIRRVAALGYKGIELMADAPHLWPAETTPQTLDAVRKTLEQHGLTLSNINAFMMNRIGDKRQPYWHPSWIEPDPSYRQIRIDHTKAALTMAKQLGARNITTEPGGPMEGETTYAAAMDQFVESLKPVVEYAEREGVRLLIEPEPGLMIERFEQYLELADRVRSPYLALNFDIGHAYCVGEDPAEWISRMCLHTHHYHVEDIPPSREHRHLIPGEGAIDLGEVLYAYRETHRKRDPYEGEALDRRAGPWLTVELYPYLDDPDSAGRAAKRHLEWIAASL